MFNFRELSQKFREAEKLYRDYRVNGLMAAAFDAADTAKNRVINKRVDDTGSIFDTYDPDYFEQKKSKKSSDDRINFSDTNRMWATTLPQVVEVNANNIKIIIKPTDPDREEVMGYHDLRFGKSIITLSPEEIAEIIKDYEEGAEDIFQSLGLVA